MANDDTHKPREFWISGATAFEQEWKAKSLVGISGDGPVVHVIEYSAYEDAQKITDMTRLINEGLRRVLAVARMVNNSEPDIRMTNALRDYNKSPLPTDDGKAGLILELEALRKERDEYRAALEKIKAINATEANGTDKERASSYWNRLHRVQSFAKEVLAKYPKESK